METKQTYSNLIYFESWLGQQLYERNMTVMHLARISGVHHNTIRNYLAKRCEPTLYNTLLIVRALGYEAEVVKR